MLERAKKEADFLIVGIYDDKVQNKQNEFTIGIILFLCFAFLSFSFPFFQTVNDIKGSNFPLMNIYERVLGVLSCRVRLTSSCVITLRHNFVCSMLMKLSLGVRIPRRRISWRHLTFTYLSTVTTRQHNKNNWISSLVFLLGTVHDNTIIQGVDPYSAPKVSYFYSFWYSIRLTAS